MRAVQTGAALGLVRELVIPSVLAGAVAWRPGWPAASVSALLRPRPGSNAVAPSELQGQDG